MIINIYIIIHHTKDGREDDTKNHKNSKNSTKHHKNQKELHGGWEGS